MVPTTTSESASGRSKTVAQYYVAKTLEYGDLITNLKLQKLMYYAYAGVLVCMEKKLFDQRIEAWPNGPVVRPLYGELKKYGSSPIGDDFLDGLDLESIEQGFSEQELDVMDRVFRRYGSLSAFELVVLTHSESPWRSAREGIAATVISTNQIEDSLILNSYSTADFEVDDQWMTS